MTPPARPRRTKRLRQLRRFCAGGLGTMVFPPSVLAKRRWAVAKWFVMELEVGLELRKSRVALLLAACRNIVDVAINYIIIELS